ncbi:MAG: class I SAM-dependent methyltransferase [Novosphingobium sp.]
MPSAPPQIFSPVRRRLARQRMRRLQQLPDAPRYIVEDIAEDLAERLTFLRYQPRRALIVGEWTGRFAATLRQTGCTVVSADPAPAAGEQAIDEERPLEGGPFDLVASVGTLDTVNDLPGALVHIRRTLAPGGLMLASFPAAGSLPALRAAMLAGDGERPAPRLHPHVDVRGGAQLLQRCGFVNPVADSRPLTVRYASFERLIGDLRAQALGCVLARPGPPLTREQWRTVQAAFGRRAEETFEILTLTGWNTSE